MNGQEYAKRKIRRGEGGEERGVRGERIFLH